MEECDFVEEAQTTDTPSVEVESVPELMNTRLYRGSNRSFFLIDTETVV
jgi:hypothetical protein